MKFDSLDEILDFAIKSEEEAVEFYTALAGKMKNSAMIQVFKDFASEESKHKEKLLNIKEGKLFFPVQQKVMDLKMTEYIDTDVDMKKELDYPEALIIAMKKEKKAFKLYSALASKTDNENLRNTLLSIAQEEAKHKLRFEIEYDELVLREN